MVGGIIWIKTKRKHKLMQEVFKVLQMTEKIRLNELKEKNHLDDETEYYARMFYEL